MKTPFLLMALATLLVSCKADVHTAPGEGDKTTVVNPPAEKKVENTTVVTPPPAEKK